MKAAPPARAVALHRERAAEFFCGERAAVQAEAVAVRARGEAVAENLRKVLHAENPAARRLRTLPGVGKVLGPVIALEIDGIARFKTADKFCAYAGLVPTTYSSGGKTSHGRMLPFCNRWLKWAFIEAAWIAIGCSDYFGAFYKRHRARGKGANEAITITARRLAKIAWKLLAEARDYAKVPPQPKPLSPAALTKD